METRERDDLLASFAAGRAALVAAIDDVPDDLARRAPAEGRWSILDCVEHIAVVEGDLFARLLEGVEGDASSIPPEREARIRRYAPHPTRPVPAPPNVVPTGRFPTVAAALAAFDAARARTIRYVETCDGDQRAKLTTHPLLGAVNCYETLLMMAAHPQRHARQIDDIKSQLAS